jgi:hypothetical protein
MEQFIGLPGHRPMQPQLYRTEVGLPRTEASYSHTTASKILPQDN